MTEPDGTAPDGTAPERREQQDAAAADPNWPAPAPHASQQPDDAAAESLPPEPGSPEPVSPEQASPGSGYPEPAYPEAGPAEPVYPPSEVPESAGAEPQMAEPPSAETAVPTPDEPLAGTSPEDGPMPEDGPIASDRMAPDVAASDTAGTYAQPNDVAAGGGHEPGVADPAWPVAGEWAAPADSPGSPYGDTTQGFGNSSALGDAGTQYADAPYGAGAGHYGQAQPGEGPPTAAMAPAAGPVAGMPPAAPVAAAPPTAAGPAPVALPKAPSRVGINAWGSLAGLVLTAGGLLLFLIFSTRMRHVTAASITGLLPANGDELQGDAVEIMAANSTIDVVPVILTILGCLLVAGTALLAAWASWAAIVPGFLLAGVSVWAMVTTGEYSGGRLIADGTRWAFSDNQFAQFCMSGGGLALGLALFLAGIAAVVLRVAVRREIRDVLRRTPPASA